ncbi:ferric reductase-like transmembrane component, partial [Lasallia pustulata]
MGWKHRLQAHPFTIASPAPPSGLRDGSWPLQLTIRAQDGFSRELLEYARFHQHAEVYLDGPYGSLEVLEAARAAERICFIAGGSGIAVTYPVAYALQVEDQGNALL